MIGIYELEKDLTDVSDRELALVSGGAGSDRLGISVTPNDFAVLFNDGARNLIISTEFPNPIPSLPTFTAIYPIK